MPTARSSRCGRRPWARTHPDTLADGHSLAFALYTQGSYAEAEVVQREVYDRHRSVLGADHPDTVASGGSSRSTGAPTAAPWRSAPDTHAT
ncbi:tetratricopeptide repeat protein [Streptomyces sp. BR123]|uniref:tetratricopeptide repeat protein n=1 Tax=Streptomyces sp. BR123 TaxID=2749828 RepID=UPI0015C4ACC0|nr:tetratricopeptide repeat protein [Streptomyces sp. BR123]NXY96222.1 tetratricopeptide repeat protein [Streptomyces sp. BR123]